MDCRRGFLWALLVCVIAGLPLVRAAEPTKPQAAIVAQRLDAVLLRSSDKSPPPRADDATFLRRLSLDLTGKLPDADALRLFAADGDPDKRGKLIDRLLAGDAHAVNWGRYWRDTLTYHTPASGNYLRWQMFDQWLVEQVKKNRPWNEMVTALVTAVGVNDESPPVNFLTALYGNQVEIASTVSRVFLGQQIQCAECHNAKTEPWKREQFHELVAFFGRARVIQHKDVGGRGTPYAIEGREEGQYRMTDKRNPDRLIAMQPRFLTGESVALEAGDAERRATLARLITSPKNPWFAKAYVNRMWTSLMGWGFYANVNDLGSSQRPMHPEVLDLLASEFVASGYDMRWLFRTIASTQAYQRHLQPRLRSTAGPAVCPVRLRPEQIFEALIKVLGFDPDDKTLPAPASSTAPAVTRHTGLRHMVYQAFKIDPSLPVEEIQGTIPQALLMMNSVMVNTYVAAKGKTVLAEMLAKGAKDDEILAALYERTLARKPKAEELEICKRFLKKVQDRQEAYEDIFWSLVNSTEFLTKK